jgi:hypothetical protein
VLKMHDLVFRLEVATLTFWKPTKTDFVVVKSELGAEEAMYMQSIFPVSKLTVIGRMLPFLSINGRS